MFTITDPALELVDPPDDAKRVPDEGILTQPQFRAAQMLIARMIAENEQMPFEFSDLGITWIGVDDLICAVGDDGAVMRVSDVMYAAIVLLWSTLLQFADSTDSRVEDLLGHLGVELAFHDPGGG